MNKALLCSRLIRIKPNPLVTNSRSSVLLNHCYQPTTVATTTQVRHKWKIYYHDFVIKNLEPDNVPQDYQMVYRSSLETYINFSVLTSATLALCGPAFALWSLCNDSIQISPTAVGTVVGLTATIGTLYAVALKAPLRMYYSPQVDNFLVCMPGLVPYQTRKVVVKPGTLVLPSSSTSVWSNFMPWLFMKHVHQPTRTDMVIVENSFSLPFYYNKLLGYQK